MIRTFLFRSGLSLGVLGLLGFLACRPLPPPSPTPTATTTTTTTATPAATPTPSPKPPAEDERKHVAFVEQFVDFEKNQVNALWRCLFGRDGDGRRFTSAEQLSMALESALFADPRAYPARVTDECLSRALRAAKELPGLEPEPPADYVPTLEEYGKALTDLAGALSLWAERAPQRIETKRQENHVITCGETWSTTENPKKADPLAWSYDLFLHCAVPVLDTLKDGQQIIEYLATRCSPPKNQPLDTEFLTRLQKTCIAGAQTAPTKAPPKFKVTLDKFVAESDRFAQAIGSCFRRLNKKARSEDLESVGKAWERTINAGTRIRQIAASKINPAIPLPRSS